MRDSARKRMPASVRLAAGAGAVLGTAVLAAGCSMGGSSGSSGGGSSPASGGTHAAGSGSGSGGTVIMTASSSGGKLLTDGSGHAVYMFSKDKGGKSACSGGCLDEWHPVTASGKVTASGGAMASDLSTITRSDGTKQVTYGGHPLYHYSDDTSPGKASGQGSDEFGARWWLVSPSGSDVTAAMKSFSAGGSGGSSPAAPASSSPKGGGGGGGGGGSWG